MRLTLSAAALLTMVPTAAHAMPPALAGALGLAPWMPALLVVAGLLFMAVEVFLIPGHGVAALLGLVAVLVGIVLSIMGPVPGPMDVAIAVGAVVSSLTLVGVAIWGVASRIRAGDPLLGGMLRREDGYIAALPRPELEGVDGIALTDLRPAGKAEIAGERLDVVSEAGWITAGSPVRVLRAEGYRHVVRAVPLPPPPPADETLPG
ncbi:MAG TPA: NfeD family protein [Longimicrobium sp.]|jgi:membrane-bound serine protease (ClpP class)|uniref:NfeD family protein n=1 Tax=Longimicrobium sp. TaxID=2029185 RepID=UPI002ED8AF46